MPQSLTTAIAQAKADNTSKKLLNEVSQTIYFLHQVREISKNVHSNIMNLTKFSNRMDIEFMNSENSKTFDPHKLLLHLSREKIKRSDKYVALSNLGIYS